MGDLMHALPAITEAKDQIPNIIFDWVVDKNFSSVPSWHPAINKTIETNHRQWKVNPFSAQSRDEIKRVIKTINDEDYDLIIDMQNNLKSAFISLLCKKSVIGMDAKSSREFPAHLAYKKKASISKKLHAIERQKNLLSFALNYESDLSKHDYGIEKTNFLKSKIDLPSNYAICVQNASWPTKQWPVKYWKELIMKLPQDLSLIFPSGNQMELQRAEEICNVSSKAIALDLLPLNEIAYLVDQASFAICSDTGLAHLSAITETPSLTLYGPTKTSLIGTYGINQNHLVANNSDMEEISVSEVLTELKELDLI